MNSNAKTSFQVNPLDINIVKIQFNLIKKLEEESDTIAEKYTCNSPVLNLAELIVTLKNSARENAILIVRATNKQSDSKEIILIKNKKEQVIEYLKSTNFFEDCKKFIKENFIK